MKLRKQYGRLAFPSGGGAAGTPYPGFDVTNREKWAYDWDDKTRRLIQERVENVPAYQFFSAEEAVVLEALCECILPQQDRSVSDRVPIAPWIDHRLHQGKTAGYRYETMPDDRQSFRFGLEGINQAAKHLFGKMFIDLPQEQQVDILKRVEEGSPPGEAWRKVPADQFFQMLVNNVITEYYAHPAAWAEIGFNGPSSPRGHIRLKLGQRDSWEADEERPQSSEEIVRRQLQSGKARKGEAKGGPTH